VTSQLIALEKGDSAKGDSAKGDSAKPILNFLLIGFVHLCLILTIATNSNTQFDGNPAA
jgi:hypothetical protein